MIGENDRITLRLKSGFGIDIPITIAPNTPIFPILRVLQELSSIRRPVYYRIKDRLIFDYYSTPESLGLSRNDSIELLVD